MGDDAAIVRRAIALYDEAVDRHGVSSRSVLWDSRQTQYLRFHELIRNLDIQNARKSVLDVGCGNAELYRFLNFLGFRGRYTGYDINRKLLRQAKKRFGGRIEVFRKDILAQACRRRFDYVLMSGLFNANVGQDAAWVKRFLARMFSSCDEALSFNAISTHVNYRDGKMFYLDPEDTLRFCIERLSRRVTLAHHNLPYNYTITVFRDEGWAAAD